MRRRELVAAVLATQLIRPVRAKQSTVPVGAIEVLSGPNAAYGVAIKQGLDLALEQINQVGVLGGRKIVLYVEDSAADKQQAINAARKLIGRDEVVAIIGPTLSGEMFAVGPVANVFPVTLRAALQRRIGSIALLYANDDAFSTSGFYQMKEAIEKAGLPILAVEDFANRDSDFSAQLTKIKLLKPDAVAISALVEPTAGLLLQARQLGFGPETLFIGGNGANSPKLGEIAGAAADGLIVGSPWFIDKPDQVNREFVAGFRTKYDHDPDQFAAQATSSRSCCKNASTRSWKTKPCNACQRRPAPNGRTSADPTGQLGTADPNADHRGVGVGPARRVPAIPRAGASDRDRQGRHHRPARRGCGATHARPSRVRVGDKIGRNAGRDKRRAVRHVPVRHVDRQRRRAP
jgi:branched-chain amino acid transport system substrate-binding protein